MNITLQTNASDTSLEFRNCRPCDDDAFQCHLSVVSSPFSAEQDFWFERFYLETAVIALEALNTSFRGNTKLGLQFEEPFVALAGDGLGHIAVSGLLVQSGPRFQRLEWEFQTDQTCLTPLLRDFRNLLSLPIF